VDATRGRITALTPLPDRSMRISFLGAPGVTYRVLATSNLKNTNWLTIGTRTAAADGTFQFDDAVAPGISTRYYRTATP
jgi:hypothetical protein